MEADIVIIGAGPIGSLAAISAKSKVNSIHLIDKRSTIGVPDHCAGLISTKGLANLGLKIPKKVIQNSQIKGAKIHSPEGVHFSVMRKKPQAIVVDRELFDQYLFDMAENKGVKTILGEKAKKISFDNQDKRVKLESISSKRKTTTITKAKLAIIATGVHNEFLKNSGINIIRKKHYYSGYQVLAENVADLDPEKVELFFNNKIAPGFFAWVIPIDKTTAKVGLASNQQLAKKRLEYFMGKNPATKNRFTNTTIRKSYAGLVINRAHNRKIIHHRLLIAGDAAGQTKATTGGGIIVGGHGGIIAGSIAKQAISQQNYSISFLKNYQKIWRQKYLLQLRIMGLLRFLLDRLDDKSLNIVIRTIIENNLDQLIMKDGDIDQQAKIIIKLLQQPSIIKLALRLIPKMKW